MCKIQIIVQSFLRHCLKIEIATLLSPIQNVGSIKLSPYDNFNKTKLNANLKC